MGETAELLNTQNQGIESVLVTGGGGYVGSALVPRLLREGYRVKVVDLFWYGQEVLDEVRDHPNLSLVDLDIRNAEGLAKELEGQDAVLHLAEKVRDQHHHGQHAAHPVERQHALLRSGRSGRGQSRCGGPRTLIR